MTLEASVLNTRSNAITVQARDHQRFFVPWGPFQPEHDDDNDRTQSIDVAPDEPPDTVCS